VGRELKVLNRNIFVWAREGFSAEKMTKENSMKTNNYKFGKYTCKAYFKPAATGFEVGFCFGPGKPIFVGNFISRAEANKWWATLNRRVKLYTTKYWIPKNAPIAWYRRFLSHSLYNDYYTFTSKLVGKHHREFTRLANTDARKYKTMKKRFKPKDRIRLVRKSA